MLNGKVSGEGLSHFGDDYIRPMYHGISGVFFDVAFFLVFVSDFSEFLSFRFKSTS